MSFADKFDVLLPDTHRSHHDGQVHVDSVSGHAPAGAIVVPDAQLLFTGDFTRSGVDLILTKDGRELVLHDYFKGEKRAALASPDGAHLTGDIVNALTGQVQFAQADGSASVATVIGHVTKLAGTATVIRNGVSIILNQGDNVNKGDVVQSGSDSTLGITFIDGTVFGLASNAKMVLNEMVYDPNGSGNSSLFSLVAGTISFVAGATAKHGDMKVDTPVATMGIRGTAVLVEIDFEVPGQGGAPPAKFQVLVEPDGTTGSYILFDKTTLNPIATVNQAGTQTIINGQGTVSFLSSVQLSADAQKIITDVFALKYTDLTNPNTKLTTNFTDSITQSQGTFINRSADGTGVPVTAQFVVVPDKQPTPSGGGTPGLDHIPGPPAVATFNSAFTERVGVTHSSTIDTVSNKINYADTNAGDVPTAKAAFNSFTYKDANSHDVTGSLTTEQLAAIHAVEIPLQVVQDPGGKNNGSATWTYSIADGAFDFLAAGETLTLTYMARVDNNFAPSDEWAQQPFTITITGTNDAPTIATTGGAITERIGTGSTAIDTISGTVTFTDVDLTDRPVVSTAISSTDPFKYLDAQGHDVTATLTPEQKAAIAAVEATLNVVQTAGNSHDGSATWTYNMVDKAFDFIAKGETLILNYVAEVDDGHGGVVATSITVSINGADVSVVGTNDVPTIATTSNAFVELSNPDQPNPTGSTTSDTVSGTISFTDVDLTDRPVASAAFTSYTYTDALGHALGLSALQQSDVDAVSVPLTVTQAAGNTNDGSASWTYSVPDGAFDFLAVGETLTLTYTATVDDGQGGVVTEPLTVTVTGSNDTPDINSSPQTGTIAELADTLNSSTPDQAHGAITFTDPDLTDTHAVTITGVSESGVMSGLADESTVLSWLSLGTLTDSIDGVTGSRPWTFSAADKSFDYLAAGETLTLTYMVQVDDHHGGVVSQPVTITIAGSNDAPVVAADVSGTAGTGLHAITELADVTGDSKDSDGASGTLAFTDVDLSDTHSVDHSAPVFNWLDSHGGTVPLTTTQLGALTAASTLGLTLHDSTGTGAGSVDVNYSAADSSFDFLAAGETLTVTYDVSVTDNNHVSSTESVTITIAGSNDAPVAHADSDQGHVVEAGNDVNDNVLPGVTTTTGNVLANDTDVDLTDTHDVVGVAAGTVGGVLSGNVGDSISGKYGSLVLNADGTWTYTLDNNDPDTNALAQGAHADDVFTYTESDHHGGTSTTTLTVGITGTNDAPVTNDAPIAVTDVNAGAPIVEQGVHPGNTPLAGVDTASGNVLSNDSDVDTGDTMTVLGVASGTPAGPLTGDVASSVAGLYGTVTIAADGTWTYTLNNSSAATQALTQGQHVSDVFTYTMHDAAGATASATLTIDITGTNDAPVVAAALADLVNEGDAAFTRDLLGGASDVDKGETTTLHVASVSYAVDGGDASGTPPAGISLGADGHTLSVDPTDPAFDHLAVGEQTIIMVSYDVTDAQGATVPQTETITITGTNDAPVIVDETDAPPQAVMVLEPVSAVVLAPGTNTNSLDLNTETFDGVSVGSGNFHSTALDATFSASGRSGVVEGSSHLSAAPFIGPGNQDTTNYLAVVAGGTETITFATEQNALGLYWGSVDPTNTIMFYEGTILVASYTGADISPLLANGNQHSFTSNGYVEFSGLHPFDKVVLSSGNAYTFEIDNISAGLVEQPHSTLAGPISGTLSVHDADIGDTLTASVIGNATIEYNDSTTLPVGTDVAALIDASDITFDSVLSDGGTDILHWTYDPTNPNLDFLHPGDVLKINFTAEVNDGHGNVGSQALTVTLVGANNSTNLSTFTVVNGTTGNDIFNNVGGNVTIFGNGGEDTFVFKPNFGNATIADFDVNHDKIDISRALFDSIPDILAAAAPTNSGHDTIITDAAHNTITLKGVTVAQLQASDFHLF